MRRRPQAIDVGLRRCLSSVWARQLLRRSVANRPASTGIPSLPTFKVASYAKIDQVEMPVWCAHDIRGLEVTEGTRLWTPRMQILQDCTQLYPYLQDVL